MLAFGIVENVTTYTVIYKQQRGAYDVHCYTQTKTWRLRRTLLYTNNNVALTTYTVIYKQQRCAYDVHCYIQTTTLHLRGRSEYCH